MPGRLSNASLAQLAGKAAVPAYDRGAVTPGIVHIGVGAFHRCHQAVYVDDCLAAGETGWGIVGASLRSPDTRDALGPQDGLYTLAVRGSDGEALRVMGAIRSLLVAPESPAKLLDALTDPRVRIVTLTVTEKAYLRAPGGGLDAAHPDVVHDLANPDSPKTVHGLLVEALQRRLSAGVLPFTVLCCDNLPANGQTARRVVVEFARLRDADLARFIEEAVAFPSSMVDRIVPATTDADRARISEKLGIDDAWPVMTEPFSQWVVEDDFPTGRPDWERFGVEMVRDVTPFEEMKLRLLNGSHSAIAYLGLLSGYQTVAESFGDPAIRRFVQKLWTEAIPTLSKDADLRPWKYTEALTTRFDNPVLRHRAAQIANDGSQKLPQRIIATALELARAEPDDVTPQAGYLETITRRHTQDYTHKRLLRGVGQFARVKIVFEPHPDGESFIFEARFVGPAVPKAYVLGVEQGIRTALESGPFAGFPVIGVKATLIDAAYHETDSSVATFEIAGRACFREAASELGFTLKPSPRASIAETNARKTSFDSLALVPAAWIAACEARGRTLPVELFTDPLDDVLTGIFSDKPNAADAVRRVFDATGFATSDSQRGRLMEHVARHLRRLRIGGVSATLAELGSGGA